MKNLFLILFIFLTMSIGLIKQSLAGPYAPPAGFSGSTAIHMDDPAFVGWAIGYEGYIVGGNVDVGFQTPEKAMGKAVGDSYDIVCLGRGGAITLTFEPPIADGDGWDFAVFENSFDDVFLELGYVEVSSNGIDFFRFTNDSLTPGPVGGFGVVNPTDVTGFGGKYRQGYGTPFDLSELDGIDPLLDVNDIGYVRIVDIIGDGTYSDTSGDVIYDPYPTSGSAGFDLDAIGVINAHFSDPWEGDTDGDGDVDGLDLAEVAISPEDYDLGRFAEEFGRTDCPL